MVIVTTRRRARKTEFNAVAKPFLQREGPPFLDVLNGEWIQRFFREHDALFVQDDIFSMEIVLRVFLAQTLHYAKGPAGRRGGDRAISERSR